MKSKFFPAIAMLVVACTFSIFSYGDGKDDMKASTETIEAVDLGLSVKWATCNLGASKPEEYGDYYGWGCTVPYADGEVDSMKYMVSSRWGCKEPFVIVEDADWPLYFRKIGGTGTSWSDCGTSVDPLREYVKPNNKSIAGTKWDAARQKLGGTWRMPTTEEQRELLNTANCIWKWTTEDGVYGIKVTSKHNGNSIFLPAAGCRYGTAPSNVGSCGCYWSSSPVSDDSDYAYGMHFDSALHNWGGSGRYGEFSVRPVTD